MSSLDKAFSKKKKTKLATTGQNVSYFFFRDFQQRIICVQTSLKKHCQEEAIQFFTLLVETEFDPLMKYINCNFPSGNWYFKVFTTRQKCRPVQIENIRRRQFKYGSKDGICL